MKILLAEHDQQRRELLEKQLLNLDHDVTVCETAETAFKLGCQPSFALLLLEQHLPEMDGLKLCRRIRATRKMNSYIILIISEQDNPENLEAILKSGADHCLKLPMSEAILRVRMMVIEREHQRLHQRIQALKALKPSLMRIERAKQEWEATADSLSSVVCLLDIRGKIVRANKTLEAWRLGEVLSVRGKTAHDLFHPACSQTDCPFQQFLTRAWRDNLPQGKPLEQEFHDSVLQRALYVQIRPIIANTNKQLKKKESFAVLVVNDISERKQAEEQLRQTGNELRAVFQSLPDEYFRLTASGNVLDYKVEGSDVPLSRTFLVKWASKLIPEEIERQFDTAIAHVLKTKQSASLTFWMPPTGTERKRFQEIRVFPFLEEQVLIVVRDMTNWVNAAEK